MPNIVTINPAPLQTETILWINRVNTAGGQFAWNSVSIANILIRQLKSKSYYSKIIYLLPMLGVGINAARVPLIDTTNVGIATNTAFINTDFNQSMGLQGNGTSKIFDLNIGPTSAVMGMGYWENNISFAGTDSVAMGIGVPSPDRRWLIDLRVALRLFSWGTYTNRAETATAATNGHFYGQSLSSSDRRLYFNAQQISSNTTSDSATLPGLTTKLMGWFFSGTTFYWAGRCAVAYITNGLLTTTEISDLDITLRNYLLGPCGKSQT